MLVQRSETREERKKASAAGSEQCAGTGSESGQPACRSGCSSGLHDSEQEAQQLLQAQTLLVSRERKSAVVTRTSGDGGVSSRHSSASAWAAVRSS